VVTVVVMVRLSCTVPSLPWMTTWSPPSLVTMCAARVTASAFSQFRPGDHVCPRLQSELGGDRCRGHPVVTGDEHDLTISRREPGDQCRGGAERAWRLRTESEHRVAENFTELVAELGDTKGSCGPL
jgi:hypothetical protein